MKSRFALILFALTLTCQFILAQNKVILKKPKGSEMLFDGTEKMLHEKWTYWQGPRFAGKLPLKWPLVPDPAGNGMVLSSHDTTAAKGKYGTADIVTKKEYRDFRLHVEFFIADSLGNSGVYLQNRYEIQIFDGDSTIHGMASVINEAKAPYSAYAGLGKWNTYDVMFRAARFSDTVRTEKARVTIYLNGIKIHDDQPIEKVWGGRNSGLDGGRTVTNSPGGIKLQAEGHDVFFRNIWIKEMDIKQNKIDF
jgi:hypothetical protein